MNCTLKSTGIQALVERWLLFCYAYRQCQANGAKQNIPKGVLNKDYFTDSVIKRKGKVNVLEIRSLLGK